MDISHTPNFADGRQDKSESSNVERETIPDSPFVLVNINNEGWFLTMGNQILIPKGNTKEELINEVTDPSWDFLTKFLYCTIEMRDQYILEEVKKLKK